MRDKDFEAHMCEILLDFGYPSRPPYVCCEVCWKIFQPVSFDIQVEKFCLVNCDFHTSESGTPDIISEIEWNFMDCRIFIWQLLTNLGTLLRPNFPYVQKQTLNLNLATQYFDQKNVCMN